MKRLFTILLLLLTLTAQGQSWQWGKRGGGSSNGLNQLPYEDVVDMATDAKGNVYALTIIEAQGVPSMTGGGSFAAYGNRDIGLVSYRCDGTFRWRKTIGGNSSEKPIAIGLDTVGHLYVMGFTAPCTPPNPSITFEGDTVLPYSHQKPYFVAQYDTSGNMKWLRYPAADTASPMNSYRYQMYDMVVDGNGDAHCLISFPASQLSGSTMTIPSSGAYMLRYSASGAIAALTPLQVGIIGNQTQFLSLRMARTRSGKFVLAGHYYISQFNPASGFSLGGQPVLNSMFVAMLGANGSVVWKRFSNDSVSGFYHRPSLDGQANIYLGGLSYNNAQFNGGTFTNTITPLQYGGPAAVAMDSLGNNLWVRFGSTNGTSFGYAGVLRGSEYVLTGGYPGKLQFPGLSTQLSHTTNTGYDAFLVRLDAQTGQAIWLDSLASPFGYNDFGTALAADKSGNVYLGGRFASSLSVAGTTLTSAGGASDFFIAKYGVAACNCTVPTAAYTKTQNNTTRTITVTYTGSPTGLDSVVWQWGDGQRLKVTSSYTTPQTHTYAAGAGSQFTVCATTYSSCGQNQTCQAVGFTTAVEGLSALEQVNVYPNPATDALTIEGAEAGLSYSLFSLLGQRVVQGVTGSPKQSLPLNHLPAGTYVLVLSSRDGSRGSIRVVKQ